MRALQNRATAGIATPHPAAAAAGRDILLRGGNAIDAAAGAMLACCVAMPGMVGLGGYGGSMVAFLANSTGSTPGGEAVAMDFDSRAPLAYRAEVYGGDKTKYDTGYLSITVPAVVAGLDLALQRFGTLPWSVVSQPALALAEDGVEVTAELKEQLDRWTRKADSLSRQALLPDGTTPLPGTKWVQRGLAGLLRRLAEDGPGAFYQGDIPRRIVRQVRDNGGILAEEDFARYRPTVVEPLAIDYRGYRIMTPPPPSGGLTSLQILKTLEQVDLSQVTPWGAEYFHLVAEAAKLSWQDRAKFLGDPDATSIPIEQLLSTQTAQANADKIRQGRVVWSHTSTVPSPPHTVNIVAADQAGNVVSMTATQGYLFGSSVAIDGLGLVMGHGMSRFDLTESSPNAPAPGKRMFHNMAPTILLQANSDSSAPGNRAVAAVGLPGGPKIVTVTAQLVVSLVDFKATPEAAVNASRIHVEADEPVAVSSAVPDSVIEDLRVRGHMVRRGQDVGGPSNEIGGVANALAIDPHTGEVAAASQAGAGAAVTVAV